MSVGVLITARLKSTRLPRKVMKPLGGRPMIDHLIDRMRGVSGASEVVVITSPLEDDRELVEHCADIGVPCFLGDPEDVMARMRDAAAEYGFDTIVSATADNPFVSGEHADQLLRVHLEGGHDFTKTEGLPWGAFAYAIDCEALKKACTLVGTRDTEVWGGYFTQSGLFDIGSLSYDDPAVRRPDYRVTVDTPADFAAVEAIIAELGTDHTASLAEIVALLDARPDIVAINANVEQKAGVPIVLKSDDGS